MWKHIVYCRSSWYELKMTPFTSLFTGSRSTHLQNNYESSVTMHLTGVWWTWIRYYSLCSFRLSYSTMHLYCNTFVPLLCGLSSGKITIWLVLGRTIHFCNCGGMLCCEHKYRVNDSKYKFWNSYWVNFCVVKKDDFWLSHLKETSSVLNFLNTKTTF